MVSAAPAPDPLQNGEPVIGVLALQGSFPLHIASLERCGARSRRVRKPGDLEGLAGLIIPGGESTTMENLAQRCGLFEALREAGRGGLPIFGTCAGAILLCCWTVKRNAGSILARQKTHFFTQVGR